MSAAINPKRYLPVPERPMSADPASTTSSGIRPSFSSFSSFSSSFSAVFGGRHSRSSSTSTQNSGAAPALTRPSSTAPQQTKWTPRPTTPGPMNPSRSSRHRSTSSASGAAAALSSSAEAPPPPLPSVPPDLQRRSSPSLPSEAVDSGANDWRTSIQRAALRHYQRRVEASEHDLRERLRGAATVSSRRRDSLSSGSSGSSAGSEGRLSEEIRLREAHQRTLARLRAEYDEEVRAGIREEARRRGVPPFPTPPKPSAPVLAPSRSSRRERDPENSFVVVEDEDWTWRPEDLSQRPFEDERLREAVRQEQQVILDAIKRAATPAQQQQALSSSASRKVHFASVQPPSSDGSANSDPPSAISMSASQTQPPLLPRTPHTPVGAGFPSHMTSRSKSAHPSASNANRSMSPAVNAPGVRPGSARPASPAYTVWMPSTGPATTTTPSGQRAGSNPIAIPGRNTGVIVEGNGSAGRERTISMGGSGGGGSWRDWSVPPHGHGHVAGIRRDAPTPSPTTTNGSSHVHSHGATAAYPRTASNSNLHSSAYATVQMHNRTPSSGNLNSNSNLRAAQHGRTPSSGNLQNGAGMRRALTPGPVSSASGYARQRTASATQRAPSVPPVLPSATRDAGREREYVYGKEYTSLRDREKRTKGVVDDREPDQEPARQVKRVQATAGLGSRTSSNRSALVDEDAPPPEVFASVPAPAPGLRTSSSAHSHARSHVANEDEEEVPPAPRRDKGKGKARAPPSPVLSSGIALPGLGKRGGHGAGGMYAVQLEVFASSLRRDLGISAEA